MICVGDWRFFVSFTLLPRAKVLILYLFFNFFMHVILQL